MFRVVQVIKLLQGPLEMGNNLPGSMIMSENEAWNRNVFKHRLKFDRDGADITLSGRLFHMVSPATGKARPPTVDSFTDGTGTRLVRAERRERRPGMLFSYALQFLCFRPSIRWAGGTLCFRVVRPSVRA